MGGVLRVGVIGAGGMGSRHAANLHRLVPDASVVGLHDVDPRRAAAAAEQVEAAVFDDPAELIAAADAVVVASPNETHARLVHACLSAATPVLCEKPLAETAEEARAVVDADRGRGLVSVGFMRRFDDPHRALHEAVAEGRIGAPLLFKGVHRNPAVSPNFSPGVVVTGSGIHDIDSARWLMSAEVTQVFCRGVRASREIPEEAFDLVLLDLALTGGRLASIEVFLTAGYGYEVAAEVVGTRGVATTESPGSVTVRESGKAAAPIAQDWLERFAGAYLAEVQAWVDSVRTGAPFPGATAWDGYAALVVADAALRSLAGGRPEPVTLPGAP